jgi:hypothetical protein
MEYVVTALIVLCFFWFAVVRPAIMRSGFWTRD